MMDRTRVPVGAVAHESQPDFWPDTLPPGRGAIALFDPGHAVADGAAGILADLAGRGIRCLELAGQWPELHESNIVAVVAMVATDDPRGGDWLARAQTAWPSATRVAVALRSDPDALAAAVNRGQAAGVLMLPFDDDALATFRQMLSGAESVPDQGAAQEGDAILALRKSHQLLEDIVENIPTAVQVKAVHDRYRVVMWNKAAESMYGLPRSKALGRNVHDLWPWSDADRMHASDVELVKHRKSVEFPDRPAQTRDRGRIRVHMRKVPLYDAHGEPTYLLVIADDVTAQVESARALAQMQARYQRALDGSRDAIWEYDLTARRLFHSDRLLEMLGRPAAMALHGPRSMLRAVHVADRPGLRRAFERLLRGDSITWEGRMAQMDGSFRWCRIRGTLTRDDQGRGVLASGTVTDIGEERRASEELRRHRDNLAELVEERTAGLESAMQAAERANRAKSDFLANISHELRTPMHAIVSFANFGVEKFEQVAPMRLKGYFHRISESAARLLKLLNDLLDLSRMEAGRMTVQCAQVDVADLLRKAIEEIEALAHSRGIGVVPAAVLAGRPMHAHWDAARMLQVLRNLLGNAVKFSPQGSLVELEARRVASRSGDAAQAHVDAIEIRVRDHGIGIPEDELETVFDKFSQSSRTNSGAGGTGLGLAICREIVTLHGGTIRAENKPPPGRGTVMILVVPVGHDQAANPDAASSGGQRDLTGVVAD